MADTQMLVEAIKPVTDNGVSYAEGKRLVMERSVAEAHEKAGVVRILGVINVIPAPPAPGPGTAANKMQRSD